MPAYQNRSVTPDGPAQYRIVDIFSTGQVRVGHVSYTLFLLNDDHIALRLLSGSLKPLPRESGLSSQIH